MDFSAAGAGEWMKENLRVTTFSNSSKLVATFNYNGGPIGDNYITPSYFDYGSNPLEGYFYNGFAIMDSRNICPTGWHIPTKLEWEELLDIFGNHDPQNNTWNPSGAALKDINYWPNAIPYLQIIVICLFILLEI